MTEDKGGTRWLFFAMVFVAIFILIGVVFLGVLNAPPHPYIPAPKTLNPNARLTFSAAADLMKDIKTVEKASDAAIGSTHGATKTVSSAQVEALVTENEPAPEKFRSGLGYDYLDIPERSIETLYTHRSKERNLARLLFLDGQVKAAHGDWLRAMSTYIDGIQMGEMSMRGSSERFGYFAENICRYTAWDTVGQLNSKQSKEASQRLAKVMAQHVPYWQSVEEQKYGTMAIAVESLRRPELYKDFQCWQPWLAYPNFVKRRILRNCERHYDKVIAITKGRFALRPPELQMPDSARFGVNYVTYDLMWFLDTKSKTENELLLVTLALHAYKLDNGHYPNSLNELLPAYIQQLPEDEFSKRGSFGYKVAGKSYVLYSVGPDGKDDGGKAICNPSKPLSDEFRIEENSKGDIVAGVNR